jgi:acetylornithine deacetylase
MIARKDHLFGRGTCDMKGFIACVLAQAEALASTPLARPYQMVFSFDEEIGCVGVRRVIDQLSSLMALPALAIIGEPTMMNPVIGHKGKIAGRITCIGHECHSSDAPHGLNAIHLATDMIQTMRAMQARLLEAPLRDEGFSVPVSTLHVGTIAGGTALNIVPRECRLEFEIRNIPADNADHLLHHLFDEAARLTEGAQKRFSSTGVQIEIVNRYPGLLMAEDSPELTRVQRLSGSNRADKISFGTEGGLFHEALGIPTYVCGPGSIDQAHKADEFIAVDQMARCLTFLEAVSAELTA